MAQFPALPLFTDAIVADCHHLTDAEFGLYMRILITMWRAPECRIPAKAEWLEKRFGRPIVEIGPLLTDFCKTDGNYWWQGRVVDEMAYVKKTSKRQTDRIKSRWNKVKLSTNGNTGNTPDCNTPHPTPPTPTDKDTIVSLVVPSEQKSLLPDEPTFETEKMFQEFWQAYPGQGKDGATGNAYKGSKKDALKFYDKLIRKEKSYEHRRQLHEAIIRGCGPYGQHLASSGYNSKHASTWLNSGGWADDYGSQAGAQLPARAGGSQKPSYSDSVLGAAGSALEEIKAREGRG